MSETSVKLFLATKMKCAVVSALISIAFVSQAFAVLRPLVPTKPAPPFNGELIIIGDDSVIGCARNASYMTRVRYCSQQVDVALWLRDGAVSPLATLSLYSGFPRHAQRNAFRRPCASAIQIVRSRGRSSAYAQAFVF